MRPAYRELTRPGRETCERDELGHLLPRDDAIVLGRKFCAGCGHWRHVCDFGWMRNRGLRARCRVCWQRESSRRYFEATPEQRERMREYWRFYQEAQRRKAGVPVRQYHRRTVIDRIERLFLDPQPLVELLDQLPDDEFTALARRAGVSERAIYRLRYGESRHVRLDLADKLALAMGSHLYSLYGDAPLVRLVPGKAA